MNQRVVAAAAAAAIVWGAAPPAVLAQEAGRDPELAALSRDAVEAVLAFDPTIEYATGLKAPSQDYFTDRSEAGLRRFEAVEDGLYARLKRIDPARLNAADSIDYAILKEQLESSIGTRVCRFELWNVGHFGWQTGLADTAAQQAVGTPEARAQALKRWGAMDRLVDDEIANLRRGLAAGYSSPRTVVARVIRQFDTFLATPAEKSPYLSPAERDEDPAFKAAMHKVVAETIYPAMQRYRDFLVNEYMPRARTSLGVSAHPNGVECYRASLRSYTTLDRTGEEVFRLGQQTVAANLERVKEVGQRTLGTTDLKSIVGRIANDPANKFKDEAELLAYSRAVVARAEKAMPQAFAVVPTQPLVVEPFPEFMRGSGVSSHYVVSTDPAKPGAYRINLDDVAGETRSQAAITAVHEGWPGHHMQLASSAALPKSDVAKLSFNGAYVEGWARYSEMLSEELGLYDNDYTLMARRLWPARGMVIDPGVHLYGWTAEQVEAYAVESGRFTAQDAKDLADRVAMWPGQLTSYDSGGLFILALREQAQRELGARFDLKGFHQVVLGSGVVPLAKLRQNVEAWIASQK